jgi:hypothetical protein
MQKNPVACFFYGFFKHEGLNRCDMSWLVEPFVSIEHSEMTRTQKPQPARYALDIRCSDQEDASLIQKTPTLPEKMARVLQMFNDFYGCDGGIATIDLGGELFIQISTNAGHGIKDEAVDISLDTCYVVSQG